MVNYMLKNFIISLILHCLRCIHMKKDVTKVGHVPKRSKTLILFNTKPAPEHYSTRMRFPSTVYFTS